MFSSQDATSLQAQVFPSRAELCFATLPTIDQTTFAVHIPCLDRRALQQTLQSEQPTRAYGEPCSQILRDQLAVVVQQTSKPFYTMLEVSRESALSVIQNWISTEPLGKISEQLRDALIEDIATDATRFIDAIGDRSITVRIILEQGSGCGDFAALLDSPDHQTSKIRHMIAQLEYDASFLFHCDEDMVNLIKSYVGAPTIALNRSDIRPDPSLERWFEIFRGGTPALAEHIEILLDRKDRNGLEMLSHEIDHKMADFQLRLPDLARSGSHPYQFLPFRPHLYFGAQEKIEGNLGIDVPKGLLHARPAVWSEKNNQKRFLVIMDSPSDIELSDLIP